MNEVKFIEASKRERFSLSKIIPTMIKNIKEYYVYYSDEFKYECWDLQLYLSKDGIIYKKFIVEAKIRDVDYDSLMLESKKLKDLKSIKKRWIKEGITNEGETDILYICFTPSGTYVYNISKLIEIDAECLKHIQYIECPKQTCGDTTEINKPVYFLTKDLAKKIDFIFNENDYQKSLITPIFKKKIGFEI
jgi:hypothetical protein